MEKYMLNKFGLFVPKHAKKKPIAIDLFCGIGGFSLGFMQTGWEVIAGLDYDYYCMVTYLMNLGSYPVNIHWIDPMDKEKVNTKMEDDMEKRAKDNGGVAQPHTSGSGWIRESPDVPGVSHYFYGDIRKISGQEILDTIGMEQGEVDCVMGGPPCQGFSMAGKRDIMDPRNSLVFEFARLVLEIMPKTMMMENVPGITNMITPEGLPVIDALCQILSDGGFGVYDALKQSLLNTSGAGAALRNKKAAKKSGDGADVQMSLI